MRFFFSLFFLCTVSIAGFGAYTLKEGKLVEKDQFTFDDSVQDQYSAALRSYENKDWQQLANQALSIIKNFPKTPFAQEATYFLGVAYYKQAEYEMANYQFTDYLTRQATPKYFEEAIEYKFEIAEMFRLGARKHLMGFKSLPKWVPAGSEALAIYDEVLSALPHHELAAHALFGKAQILGNNQDYRASIEVYQTLIRRFPKHPLAVESYVGVGEVYLKQSRSEYPDPDFLDLAGLNLRKFRTAFPSEDQIAVAERHLAQMQEHYAGSLFEIAQFYERTSKWGAAKIYYTKILKSYSGTEMAVTAKDRIEYVESKIDKMTAKKAASKK